MLITTFVFIGIEGASVYSRYAKKREDVGRATVLGFLSVLSIFALVTLSSYSVVPQPELAATRQPSMVGVFESVVGDWGEVFISVAVIVSVLGAYLAWTLMAAEVMYIPARADDLPAFLGQENEARDPDHRARRDLAGRPGPARADAVRQRRPQLHARPRDEPRAAALLPRRRLRPQARPDRRGLRGRLAPACVARRRSSPAPPRRTRCSSSTPPGMKFLLLATVLLAPATLLYVKARSEHGPPDLQSHRDRAVRRDPRRRPRSASSVCGPAASPSDDPSAHQKGIRHDRQRVLDVRRPLRGRPAPQGARLRARPGAPPAHPQQQRRAAVRRRDVGRERPARPRRLREQADPARGRGRRAARPAGQTLAIPGARDWLLDRKIVPNRVGLGLVDGTRAYLESLEPRAARGVPHRRSGHQRPARGLPLRLHQPGPRVDRRPRVPHAAAAEHALHPGHDLLAVRRAHDEPALLAGPQGRDPHLQGDLRVPPRLRRLDGVVGGPGAGVGAGDASRAATSCRSATAWCSWA